MDPWARRNAVKTSIPPTQRATARALSPTLFYCLRLQRPACRPHLFFVLRGQCCGVLGRASMAQHTTALPSQYIFYQKRPLGRQYSLEKVSGTLAVSLGEGGGIRAPNFQCRYHYYIFFFTDFSHSTSRLI